MAAENRLPLSQVPTLCGLLYLLALSGFSAFAIEIHSLLSSACFSLSIVAPVLYV